MTNEERQRAIEWMKGRPVMMAGAKRMYDLAVEALEAYVPDMNDGNTEPSCENDAEITRCSHDTISRQAAIDIASGYCHPANIAKELAKLPSAQPEQTNCEYCHTDRDGYIKPLEKNCHAFIRFGMDGWTIELKAKGWKGEAPINFCPVCGRRLIHE